MTPKEKAKELVDKFIEPTKVPNVKGVWVEDIDGAKQCALIAVDELIDNCDNSIVNEFIRRGAISYWNEVKQEIEKL